MGVSVAAYKDRIVSEVYDESLLLDYLGKRFYKDVEIREKFSLGFDDPSSKALALRRSIVRSLEMFEQYRMQEFFSAEDIKILLYIQEDLISGKVILDIFEKNLRRRQSVDLFGFDITHFMELYCVSKAFERTIILWCLVRATDDRPPARQKYN